MNTLTKKISAISLHITDTHLIAHLADGREISVPLSWFPRLAKATIAQRQNWRWIAQGQGIHWEEIDEDISVGALLQ